MATHDSAGLPETAAEELARLLEWDAAGVFPGENENFAAFQKRVRKERRAAAGEYQDASPIPEAFFDEASDLTEKHYAFRRRGDRGYFLSRGLGWLWGGCAEMDARTNQSRLFLRDVFKTRKKWLFFRRDELLAHELCHLARWSVNDDAYEEYFAYRLSFSALRRIAGDALSTPAAAFSFLAAAFLAPLAALIRAWKFPEWQMIWFYLPLIAVVAFFAFCSIKKRRRVVRAEKKLRRFSVERPLAVLFRCNADEIAAIAACPDEKTWRTFLAERAKSSLRWRTISRRFCGFSAKND